MTTYRVGYRRPGELPGSHDIGAKTDAEARIRFLNLDWVAFTDIEIISIDPLLGDYTQDGRLPDRPYDPYRPRVRSMNEEIGHSRAKAGRRKSARADPMDHTRAAAGIIRPAAAKKASASDWRKQCDRLTAEIAGLADAAQTLVRLGKHDEAAEARAKAKKLAAERAAITKRNKGR